MTDNVWVNAERTAVVDQFAPGKKWQMSRKEAQRLGLLGEKDKPQVRRSATPQPEQERPTQAPRRQTRRKRAAR